MPIKRELVTGPEQLRMDLKVAAEREIDGIGMGVLSDGVPYLTIRGLARMCGVDNASIIRITADWVNTPLKPREKKIKQLVEAQGADATVAFIALKNGEKIYHAVPAAVCMAVLEYYAFEARVKSEKAANSYRVLARKGFNDFIYAQVGYNPSGESDVAWKQFHDRVSLAYHTVPDGYFSVFKELADLYVTLIREGAALGDSFIPDISVGQHWSKYWNTESLDVLYGDRKKYTHNYPGYFPQSTSNPQAPYCYPDEALPEFREWIKKVYTVSKMPKHLDGKVKQGQIDAPAAEKVIEAFSPKVIEVKH